MVLEFQFPVSLIGNILPNNPGTLDCRGVWSGTQQVEVPRLYTMMGNWVSSALHLSRAVEECKTAGPIFLPLTISQARFPRPYAHSSLNPLTTMIFVCVVCVLMNVCRFIKLFVIIWMAFVSFCMNMITWYDTNYLWNNSSLPSCARCSSWCLCFFVGEMTAALCGRFAASSPSLVFLVNTACLYPCRNAQNRNKSFK